MDQALDAPHGADVGSVALVLGSPPLPASLEGPEVAMAGMWEPLSVWYFLAHPLDEFVLWNYWDPERRPLPGETFVN